MLAGVIAAVTVLMLALMLTVKAEPSYAAEEEVFDNHLNVLTVIYTNINTPDFKNSFSSKEVNEIKTVVSNAPDNFKRLSGGRFIIDKVDFKTITEPITSVSGSSASSKRRDLNYDSQDDIPNDINIDSYLENDEYDLVYVFAPLSGIKVEAGQEWYGLGGSYYYFNGRRIYYAIANDSPALVGKARYKIYNDYYDTRLGVVIHEILHCIETNSRNNGYSDFEILHSASDNGYKQTQYNEWLDWYHDLMQDKLKNGKKGFTPEAFKISHPKRVDSYVESISVSGGTLNVKTGKTFKLKPTVSPAGAYYQSLTWASSDPYAATVSKDGTVKTYSKGKVTITVSANTSTYKAKCVLNITGKDKLPVYTTDNGKLKVTKNRNGTVKLVGVTSKAPKVLRPDYAVIKGEYYTITHIGEYALKGNKKIQEIDLNDTYVKTIEKGAFYGMKKLWFLAIRKSIKKLPVNMAKNCRKLEIVEIEGKLTSVGKGAFVKIHKKPRVWVPKKTSKKIKKKIKKQIHYKLSTF